MPLILAVNAGSSSIKAAAFDGAARVAAGLVEEIGGSARLRFGSTAETVAAPGHGAALALLLARMADAGAGPDRLAAAGHRVVHGGGSLTAPVRVTDAVLAEIDRCAAFAPLHNPHNAAGIRALAALLPDLPQVACFDTAFHATNPAVATTFALPEAMRAAGVRRYGFHGLSYQGLEARLPVISGAALPRRLLACHLGNGASLAAIEDGQGVATTMGFSPLDGLTMGTRSGSLDPGAVFHLLRNGWTPAELEAALNRESGLKGLSGGLSDMRALLADGSPAARFAVDHFCYWAVRHAGSMIAAMGGLDAVAFTGGIGENAAPVRAAIMQGLAWTGLAADGAANDSGAPRLHGAGSAVAAWIVPADEEAEIARLTAALTG